MKKHKNVFCSKRCEGDFKKKQHLNTACVVCHKKIHVKPSHISKKHGNCCSVECMAILRKSLYKGCSNPNYNNRGENNPIFKHENDIKLSPYGYVLIRCPQHPFSNCDGYVFEHRLIVEEFMLNLSNSIIIDGNSI